MKFADVKEGDVLIADGGFTCIEDGAKLTVFKHSDNGLYVLCEEGEHYLDGQIDWVNFEELVGFSQPEGVT